MFSTVLVGVDGQSGGHDAIAMAVTLASPGSDLVLMHVWETLDGVAAAALTRTPPARAGRELLERARRGLDHPCRATTHEAMSAPAGLLRAAEDANADLLVLGSCARQGVDRLLLGSETRAALHGAPCAVAAPGSRSLCSPTAGGRHVSRSGSKSNGDEPGPGLSAFGIRS